MTKPAPGGNRLDAQSNLRNKESRRIRKGFLCAPAPPKAHPAPGRRALKRRRVVKKDVKRGAGGGVIAAETTKPRGVA